MIFKRRIVVPLLALIVTLLVLAPIAFRALMRHREQNPLLTGRRLAAETGCLACHAPYRGVELPNPGSLGECAAIRGRRRDDVALARSNVSKAIRSLAGPSAVRRSRCRPTGTV